MNSLGFQLPDCQGMVRTCSGPPFVVVGEAFCAFAVQSPVVGLSLPVAALITCKLLEPEIDDKNVEIVLE